MKLALPFFAAAPMVQPHQDPWPPTWRLPWGAIQVEATYKEPGRQKLVDKSTRAVAFLALMFAVLGHDRWPFPEATTWILQTIADGSAALPELIAARAIVGLLAVVIIVGSYRLVLAATGLDRGKLAVTFEQGRIIINGRAYDRRIARGFELEPHPLARQEEHRDRQQQVATPLYYRNSFVMIYQYGERRINIAQLHGKPPASQLLARLQSLHPRSTNDEARKLRRFT